ncbi:golgi membrane protein [Syncephalastrum racemosum]|uniref:Protein RER1 n=1 Tax=Syncephalastrum racemosum TaxID=13706 RepID=A0A1X2HCA5_SYNRA|nr:golgi membrane protein [Syncephalastrum racemosum]
MNDISGDANEGPASNLLAQKAVLEQRWQRLLDQVTPFVQYRWIGFAVLMLLFITRILYAQGWYIVTYALGIYLLNLFLAFLTPKFDPSIDLDTQETEMEEGPSLPTKADEEFKPFIRRLPEFKFWYSATKATAISLFCSFFSIFDIPVFWPILLIYFCILFAITMRRQIKHMIKYRYIPFDLGKKNYHGASNIASSSRSK